MAKISVIMTNYNREKYLKRAVQSVIAQSFTDWELIFIDDCSTDHSLEIAKKIAKKEVRVKIVSLKKNRGHINATIAGLNKSEGEYITFLDSDDLLDKRRLKEQLGFMQRSNLDFSYCDMLRFEGNRKKIEKAVDFKKNFKKILLECSREDFDLCTPPKQHLGYKDHKKTVYGGGFMFKRKILKKCRFDRKLTRMPDQDFWFQIICKGFKIQRFPKAYYFYRTHNQQVTKNEKEMLKSARRINKKLKKGLYFNL